MKTYTLVLQAMTGERERIGACCAHTIDEALELLNRAWQNEHPDGYIPGTCRLSRTYGTLAFGFTTLHVFDAHAEALERTTAEQVFAGNHHTSITPTG